MFLNSVRFLLYFARVFLHPKKSKADLARALGLEPPAISKILNETRQVKAHEYTAMRRFFGLPVDGERAANAQSGYVLEPLAAGAGMSEQATFGVETSENWIIPASVLNARTKAPSDQVKIFEVKEAVMGPDYRQGEHVLVDQTENAPSPPGVFVVSDGYGHLLRQCEMIMGSSPPAVRISARDEDFISQTIALRDIQIVGRVIAKLQWV